MTEITPRLSSRGQAQLDSEGTRMTMIKKILSNMYHPRKNENGFINIGVAENTLVHQELTKYFNDVFRLEFEDFCYNDAVCGTHRLHNALANFFNKYFEPHAPVVPDHVLGAAGATTILSHFFRSVADSDEGALVVEPYYFAFDNDLGYFNNVSVVPVPVPLDSLFTLKEIDCLESALRKSEILGRKIRSVILCNPHNPVGQCYPREVILAYAQFCQRHDLHLLSDEIYAMSVFPTRDNPHPQRFISALSFDFAKEGVHPGRVHVLYGMSKDFNANAFRIGCLVSQYNPNLLTSILVTSLFMMVSSPSDILWSALLNDNEFLPKFFQINQERLSDSYGYVTDWLRFHLIPYIPSNAGHYLMIDMRQVLTDPSVYNILPITKDMDMRERENVLIAAFLKSKLFVSSGSTYHMPEGGWLRLTFSLRRDYFNVALRRIEALLKWESWGGYASYSEDG